MSEITKPSEPTGEPGQARDVVDFRSARAQLLADRSLAGRAWAEAMATRTDEWLAGLFDQAVTGSRRGGSGVALLAVGGYGRGELCPGSDIDVLLVHTARPDIAEIAERLWYPVWDGGVPLGHAVRTPRETLTFAADDLDTATALLSCRFLAGDGELADHVTADALAHWRRRGRHHVAAVAAGVAARQARAGEVAYLLEPDLKDGRGGQRDVHALGWAELARPLQADDDSKRLHDAYDTLLDVRVELQRLTGRRGNVLALQYQDEVAVALGDGDADALMGRVAAAARAITWTADEAWARGRSWLDGPGEASGRERDLGDGLWLSDGVVHVDPRSQACRGDDPTLALRAATAAARARTRIDRASLRSLANMADAVPEVWPVALRAAWTDLLGAGHAALALIDSLDQVGVWERYVPEWPEVRNKPQRNAYHRFTVDRHLLETVANAAALVDRVARPDLLLTGALLHDLGKGRSGDHVAIGEALAVVVASRMGFAADDVDVLRAMVRLHLLLPDTATRRDLADPATVARVCDEVGTVPVLELLGALCEADSLATGPAAWSPWKAELVDELVARTRSALEGGAAPVTAAAFPSPQQLRLLEAGSVDVRGDDDLLTVVAPDRPGLLSRVAGALALHGLDVLSAEAVSTEAGMALEQFRVGAAAVGARDTARPWAQRWPSIAQDVTRAIRGRLAVDARLAERARAYRSAVRPPGLAPPQVTVDNDASATSTVLEVSAPDSVGLLYRVTRALAELDLDVHTAKVQTLGAVVVDAFYVVDRSGGKVTDADHLGEIERAVLAAVEPRA